MLRKLGPRSDKQQNEKSKQSRVDHSKLAINTDDYLKVFEPKNTTKANKTCLNSYRAVMKEVAEAKKETFKDLPDEDVNELPKKLELYFPSIVKEDGSKLNASSLQAYFDGIRRILRHNHEVDIKADPDFFKMNQTRPRWLKLKKDITHCFLLA